MAGIATAYLWKQFARNQDLQIRIPPIKKIAFSPPKGQLVKGEPDIIRGPDFYEILAEVTGISGLSDVSVDFESHNRRVRIVDNKSKISQILANLPEDASKFQLREIDYLNGIIRVRLS